MDFGRQIDVTGYSGAGHLRAQRHIPNVAILITGANQHRRLTALPVTLFRAFAGCLPQRELSDAAPTHNAQCPRSDIGHYWEQHPEARRVANSDGGIAVSLGVVRIESRQIFVQVLARSVYQRSTRLKTYYCPFGIQHPADFFHFGCHRVPCHVRPPQAMGFSS